MPLVHASIAPEAKQLVADARTQQTAYNRDYATYDDEAIAAVDKFRKDRQMDYQGDPPGLVDARLVAALRSAYFEKKKASLKK